MLLKYKPHLAIYYIKYQSSYIWDICKWLNLIISARYSDLYKYLNGTYIINISVYNSVNQGFKIQLGHHEKFRQLFTNFPVWYKVNIFILKYIIITNSCSAVKTCKLYIYVYIQRKLAQTHTTYNKRGPPSL